MDIDVLTFRGSHGSFMQNIFYAAIFWLAKYLLAMKGQPSASYHLCQLKFLFQLGSFPILNQLDICTPK